MTSKALAKSNLRFIPAEPARLQAEAVSAELLQPDSVTADRALEPRRRIELVLTGFLRAFHVLLRSKRLYQKNHPRVLESLETTGQNLRRALELLSPVAIRVERDRILAPLAGELPLANPRGELTALAADLSRCGITSLVFLPESNLGEVDLLAHLLNSFSVGGVNVGRGLAEPPAEWPALLAQHHICGVEVNAPIKRKPDTALASLIASLMAYGGSKENAEGPPAAPPPEMTFENLTSALRLLTRLSVPLERAQLSSPQQAAREFHAALAETERETVSLLLGILVRHTPHENELPRTYISRLAELTTLEFAVGEYAAGRVAPPELPGLLARLGDQLASGGGWVLGVKKAGASKSPDDSSLVAPWAAEVYAERLHERFWAELPEQEKSEVLRGPYAWCMPIAALGEHIENLLAAHPETPGQQGRLVMLDYLRCLSSKESQTRLGVAAGLVELHPLFERLWPHQLPEEVGRTVVEALVEEASPGIAGLLSAVTENLARLAVAKGDYAEFERIVKTLEAMPRDAGHVHLSALAVRLVADERWLLLVDAALSTRPLDPVLPRLLRRDPKRLLDRLGLLLTAPDGSEHLPAMARLLRSVGEPALRALESRLFEPRRQRAATAIKLLVLSQPERLIALLPHALPSWDWSLQDLAVSELARSQDRNAVPVAAQAFVGLLTSAHLLVVPMMLDQIGLADEYTAVPLLMEIAAGENKRLKDVFIRIKAIEALGRLRAIEATELLGDIVRQKNGLTYLEPAGLRVAAAEALALIEERASLAQMFASGQTQRGRLGYAHPRRYPRVSLPSPMPAQIEGTYASTAGVRTISMGGAYLESSRRLAVGDSMRVEIRSGLQRIQSTAVVRNVSTEGGGVEFVHMNEDDREKLRRLIQRLRRS